MNVNRLLVCFMLLGAGNARAQQTPLPVLQVFDQVCLAHTAQACFDSVYPPQFTLATPGAIGCSVTNPALPNHNGIAQYYTANYHFPQPPPPVITCTRVPLADFAAAAAPVLQVCEQDARIHYADACVRTLPVAELVHTLDVDLEKLLSEFCQTYADPSKCANIKPIPGTGQ
ncbi:hypothetical protein G3A43_07620 [Paraburkholderia aspalathi]|nr:hypothetical protein [Paraburkholderia aspalathi]MBK3780123.1 hypothetical protein [Paraburkholderia aspalathi]